MLQQQVHVLNTFLMALDAICIIMAGYAAYYLTYYLLGGSWAMEGNIFIASVLLVMFVNNYVMGRLDLYSDRNPSSWLSLAWAIFKAILADFTILATAIYLIEYDLSRRYLANFMAFSFFLIMLERTTARLYITYASHQSYNTRNILVVGNLERGKYVSEMLARQLSWGHEVIGHVAIRGDRAGDSLGWLDDLPEILRDKAIDEVVFAVESDRAIELRIYLEVCRKMGKTARILPALWKPDDQSLSVERCQGVPFLTIKVGNFDATGLIHKRLLDIAGGLAGAFFFLLIYPWIALAIKRDSPGPVLFKQKRMGKNGRIFHLYKFRSMYQDAEQHKQELLKKNEMNGAMFKLKNDPRITRVGRWLRRTSLDEVPQFLNVLKGEMSLVGTRPPTVDEVQEYQLWQLKRISAKPGITGLWQISGRNKITDFDKVVILDCQYLDNWCLLEDLKIPFKTMLVVLQRKGAL